MPPGCANDCGGRGDCLNLSCCHTCGLFADERCVNDAIRGFLPRYQAGREIG